MEVGAPEQGRKMVVRAARERPAASPRCSCLASTVEHPGGWDTFWKF